MVSVICNLLKLWNYISNQKTNSYFEWRKADINAPEKALKISNTVISPEVYSRNGLPVKYNIKYEIKTKKTRTVPMYKH